MYERVSAKALPLLADIKVCVRSLTILSARSRSGYLVPLLYSLSLSLLFSLFPRARPVE